MKISTVENNKKIVSENDESYLGLLGLVNIMSMFLPI